MEEDELTCGYCEAEFTVTHEHINEVQFCPFCATPIEVENEDDDSEKEWE